MVIILRNYCSYMKNTVHRHETWFFKVVDLVLKCTKTHLRASVVCHKGRAGKWRGGGKEGGEGRWGRGRGREGEEWGGDKIYAPPITNFWLRYCMSATQKEYYPRKEKNETN